MKTHRLILNSAPESIHSLKKWVDDISRDYGICEELYPDILVCLTEAVNNAIHHGNKCDDKKNISLVCNVKKHKLEFKVCDEGVGFHPGKIPDPTTIERIGEEHGRGVMIMKQLAHKVVFKKQGTKVIMTFRYKNE